MPSTFSPSTFSPSTFSPSTFSPSTFSPSTFSPDGSARILPMVLEVALIDITAGSEDAFEKGYREVETALTDSPGLLSIRMTRGVETPSRFVLLVEWESVDAHQAFRDSDRYAIWRGGIGPYFAQAPHVEHFADID
jgi:heme-degrading monooxygenase HmoA